MEASRTALPWPQAMGGASPEGVPMSAAKEELIGIIEQQPDQSSVEDIVRELAFHVMVQRGLADSDQGRTISHEEMGRRIRQWGK